MSSLSALGGLPSFALSRLSCALVVGCGFVVELIGTSPCGFLYFPRPPRHFPVLAKCCLRRTSWSGRRDEPSCRPLGSQCSWCWCFLLVFHDSRPLRASRWIRHVSACGFWRHCERRMLRLQIRLDSMTFVVSWVIGFVVIETVAPPTVPYLVSMFTTGILQQPFKADTRTKTQRTSVLLVCGMTNSSTQVTEKAGSIPRDMTTTHVGDCFA